MEFFWVYAYSYIFIFIFLTGNEQMFFSPPPSLSVSLPFSQRSFSVCLSRSSNILVSVRIWNGLFSKAVRTSQGARMIYGLPPPRRKDSGFQQVSLVQPWTSAESWGKSTWEKTVPPSLVFITAALQGAVWSPLTLRIDISLRLFSKARRTTLTFKSYHLNFNPSGWFFKNSW